jgi:hypothetical protein
MANIIASVVRNYVGADYESNFAFLPADAQGGGSF